MKAKTQLALQRLPLWWVASWFLFAIAPQTVSADIIQIRFDNVEGPNLGVFGSVLESGYAVTAISGEWQISRSSSGGNLPPAIFSRSSNSQIEIVGPIFSLIDFETNDGSLNSGISTATYQLEGFLNNNLVLTGMGNVSPNWEANSSPNSLQPLDRLRISFNLGQTTGYGIDNIRIQAVPEPSYIGVLSVLAIAFWRRCCNRQAGPRGQLL
jgi:hypothetical protein